MIDKSHVHRLVVAGFIFRVNDPGSDFNQRYVSGALKENHIKMFALVSSPRELEKSLSIASIRPLKRKLLQ
jgi:hypothetical protein